MRPSRRLPISSPPDRGRNMERIKKEKGGADGYIAFVCVLMIVLALLSYFLDFEAAVLQSRKVENIMRKYVLIMEGNGCLTDLQQQELTLELEQMGIRDITYLKDPKIKVNYGEEVILSISARADVFQIKGLSGLQLVRTKEGIAFSKTMKSTAQY